MSKTILNLRDLSDVQTMEKTEMAAVRGGVAPIAGIALTVVGAGLIAGGLVWPSGNHDLITPEVRNAGSR